MQERRWMTSVLVAVCLAVSVMLPAQPAGAQVDVTVGLDGSKQPQDLGVNANLGPRVAVDGRWPLITSAGLGIQAGVAVNVADAAVAVLERVDGTSGRRQLFATVGLFQSTARVRWAIVYDHQHQSYFDEVRLGQVRGEVLVAAGPHDWIGAWFTAAGQGASAAVAGSAVRLAPIGQVNAVLRHTWRSGATTGLWLGVAGGHHNVVLVFPENTRDRHVLVYGADVRMPLSDRAAIVGAANLVTPSASGTVDAFMGVSFRLGRSGGRGGVVSPLAVANNTAFAVDLARR